MAHAAPASPRKSGALTVTLSMLVLAVLGLAGVVFYFYYLRPR
jgi:uncharacterized protein HemX